MTSLPKFYSMWFGYGRKTMQVSPMKQLEVGQDLEVLLGTYSDIEDLTFRYAGGGTRATDIIFCRLPIIHLVSRRVIALLEAGRFSGWSSTPTVILDKSGSAVLSNEHMILHITGTCGRLLNDTLKPNQLMTFDSLTWDGSDLFVPSGTGVILCTPQVRAALRAAKIVGLGFETCLTT